MEHKSGVEREWRNWRWRCPHCAAQDMSLHSAVNHLERRHLDCWACRLERHMLKAMLAGEVFLSEEELPF